MRPGLLESGRRWPLVRSIYADLTGRDLPEVMPPREWRKVDAVICLPGEEPRILEVDESQHFTQSRAVTLRHYPTDVTVGFPHEHWLARSAASRRKLVLTSRADRPCPPLFPRLGGRRQQRAFRDALADLLPGLHGWAPTVRIAYFEVKHWIGGPDAVSRMRALLETRGLLV